MKRFDLFAGVLPIGLLALSFLNASSEAQIPEPVAQDPVAQDSVRTSQQDSKPAPKASTLKGSPPQTSKPLRAFASRKASYETPNLSKDGYVTGTGAFPVSLNVSDIYTTAGDTTLLKAPADRRVQVCVLVFPEDAKGVRGPVFYKYKSEEIMVTKAGKSQTLPFYKEIPMQPGEYGFQVFVCDPDVPYNPVIHHCLEIPENDPFIPGRVMKMSTGGLKVLPAE